MLQIEQREFMTHEGVYVPMTSPTFPAAIFMSSEYSPGRLDDIIYKTKTRVKDTSVIRFQQCNNAL